MIRYCSRGSNIRKHVINEWQAREGSQIANYIKSERFPVTKYQGVVKLQ